MKYLFLLQYHIRCKTIKNFIKIVWGLLLVLISLPVVSYFFIQSSYVQTYLIQRIVTNAALKTGSHMSIEAVDVTFFREVLLKNIQVYDLSGDTLVHAGKISAGIDKINTRKQFIRLGSVRIEDLTANIIQFPDKRTNYRFLLDSLISADTAGSKPWKFDVRAIQLADARISYKNLDSLSSPHGIIDYSNLNLKDLQMDISHIDMNGEGKSLVIEELSFRESSGFILKQLAGEFTISDSAALVDNFSLITPHSRLESAHAYLYYDSLQALKYDPKKIRFDARFEQSTVSTRDVNYFIHPLQEYLVASFYGNLSGSIGDITGRGMRLAFGSSTALASNFDIRGLPDLDRARFTITIPFLRSNAADIRILARLINDSLTIPGELGNLGNIRLSGKFNGRLNSFSSAGKIQTDLGDLTANINYAVDSTNNNRLEGKINTPYFHLGRLLGSSSFGGLSLNSKVKGIVNSKQDFYLNTSASISNMGYKEYEYKTITVDGHFSDKAFDGDVMIDDPNADLDFSGMIDLSGDIPEYNFSATSRGLELFTLNLTDSSVLSNLTFTMDAVFEGNDIDNLRGNIDLEEAVMEKSNKRLTVKNLKINAGQHNNDQFLRLHSDFMDAEIQGKYHFVSLVNEFQQLVKNYFPSLYHDSIVPVNQLAESEVSNDFRFDFRLKNLNPVTRFFMPEYYVDTNTVLTGRFDKRNQEMQLNLEAGFLRLNQYFIDSFRVNMYTTPEKIYGDMNANLISVDEDINLHSFVLRSIGQSDSARTRIGWGDPSKNQKEGEVFINNYLSVNRFTRNTRVIFDILPSSFYINDKEWMVDESTIELDSNSIGIPNDFRINQGQKRLTLYGKISENPEDTAYVTANKLDIGRINLFRDNRKLQFYGELRLNTKFANVYREPVFTTNLFLEDFQINDEFLGLLDVDADWDEGNELVNISGTIANNDTNMLDLKGQFVPRGKKVQLACNLTGFPVKILNPLLQNSFSDFQGKGYGKLTIDSSLENLLLNGAVDFRDVSFTLDPLQTTYHFSDEITVENNSVRFNAINAYDSDNNTAIVDGNILLNDFRNVWVNMNIEAAQFHVLNTTSEDSPDVYGRVFASGDVSIEGPGKELVIDIEGNTESNSVLYFPINSSEEIEEHDFLTFTKPVTKKEEIYFEAIGEDRILRKGEAEINMDIEIRNNIQLQLIFDPQIGDVMRARGDGNVSISLSKEGELQIFGDYVISEGSYLFTLQNVINKKFNVEEGSSIGFNGDISNSTVDIIANYELRTQLYDLVATVVDDEDKIQKYKRRTPVRCQIILQNNLYNPNISFDIKLPNADEETRVDFRNALNKGVSAGEVNNDQLTKQFLSLMVLNRFMPNTNLYAGNIQASQAGGLGYQGAAVTTSELLSNQLSSWLSQISDEFDVGFNYLPGDELTQREMEVALSTQLLNDRVIINGNLDMLGNQTQESNIVGDFQVEYKITESGKLRVKAYHQTNDRLIYDYAPHTQGIGIFYREDFHSFGDLFGKYWGDSIPARRDTIR